MKRIRWTTVAGLVVVLLILAWGWFSSGGFGEYADSPDGRYHAHVSSLSRGTWLHGRIHYVEMRISVNASSEVIWEAQRYLLPGEVAPDFGDRRKQLIQWAPDSRSVSIPVGGPTDAQFVVPK